MPSNVQPPARDLREVGLDTLDAAARTLRRRIKGVDTSGPLALFHHADVISVRGTDVRLDVTLRGPDCHTRIDAFEAPRVGPQLVDDDEPLYIADPLPEPAARVRALDDRITAARRVHATVAAVDLGRVSVGDLLYLLVSSRDELGALLDAIERS